MLNKALFKALVLAARAHKGQKDKGGKPYIFHPLHVAACVRGAKCKQAALLHDVIEDTLTTIDEIRAAGFCDDVVQALDAITKRRQNAIRQFSTVMWHLTKLVRYAIL